MAGHLRTPGLKEKLQALEARKAELDALLSARAPSPVRPHPNMAELYRRKVGDLTRTLQDPGLRVPALESIRSLISRVTVQRDARGVVLELEGALSAMVGQAQGGTTKSPLGSGLDASSVQVVAGAGVDHILRSTPAKMVAGGCTHLYLRSGDGGHLPSGALPDTEESTAQISDFLSILFRTAA